MMHGGLDIKNTELLLRWCQGHFYKIRSVVKIQVFQENNSVKNVEFELQENTETNPPKNLPEFLQF